MDDHIVWSLKSYSALIQFVALARTIFFETLAGVIDHLSLFKGLSLSVICFLF